MKITQIPFPRLPLQRYLTISFVIAFTVSFILMVFQPFGTSNFKHPNKHLILAGYGIVIFITMAIFYFLSLHVVHKNKAERWNIVLETMDVFLATILSLLACYFYFLQIFNQPFASNHFFYFLFNAATVALLPVIGCLGYLYFQWKDVRRSSLEKATENQSEHALKLILGNNKSDQVEVSSDEIILAQAQSNYVMLYVQKNEKVQRHILRSTLKQIKEQLDEHLFLQAHRSYIINKSRIQSISGNKSKAQLQLDGFDKNIPISRNIYETLKTLAN